MNVRGIAASCLCFAMASAINVDIAHAQLRGTGDGRSLGSGGTGSGDGYSYSRGTGTGTGWDVWEYQQPSWLSGSPSRNLLESSVYSVAVSHLGMGSDLGAAADLAHRMGQRYPQTYWSGAAYEQRVNQIAANLNSYNLGLSDSDRLRIARRAAVGGTGAVQEFTAAYQAVRSTYQATHPGTTASPTQRRRFAELASVIAMGGTGSSQAYTTIHNFAYNNTGALGSHDVCAQIAAVASSGGPSSAAQFRHIHWYTRNHGGDLYNGQNDQARLRSMRVAARAATGGSNAAGEFESAFNYAWQRINDGHGNPSRGESVSIAMHVAEAGSGAAAYWQARYQTPSIPGIRDSINFANAQTRNAARSTVNGYSHAPYRTRTPTASVVRDGTRTPDPEDSVTTVAVTDKLPSDSQVASLKPPADTQAVARNAVPVNNPHAPVPTAPDTDPGFVNLEATY